MSRKRQGAAPQKISEGIGGRIREARKVLGLTQQALSDMSGHSKAQIAQWEISNRTPGVDGLYSLANAMGISFLWLATGEGDSQATSGAERRPKFSAPLLKACATFAFRYISDKYPSGGLDPAELTELLYLLGVEKGFDAEDKTLEECEAFFEGAAEISVSTNFNVGASPAWSPPPHEIKISHPTPSAPRGRDRGD